jgi:hypothetical protein
LLVRVKMVGWVVLKLLELLCRIVYWNCMNDVYTWDIDLEQKKTWNVNPTILGIKLEMVRLNWMHAYLYVMSTYWCVYNDLKLMKFLCLNVKFSFKWWSWSYQFDLWFELV